MREINDIENTLLDTIDDAIVENNTSYELINIENIYDDEIDVVYREYTFNRGNEDYNIAISPTGFIRFVSENIPNNLIIDISNSLIYMLNSLIVDSDD